MIEQVDGLPEHIELSKHLQDQAEGYVRVQYFGHSFYIALTPEVKKMLDISDKKRKGWLVNDHALRGIVDSLYLQIRDYVLAGVAEEVKGEMMNRLEQVISKPIQNRIEQVAEDKERKLLEEKKL